MIIDISTYRDQVDSIGDTDLQGPAEERAKFYKDQYKRAYALALAVVEAVEDSNEAFSQR